MSTRKAYIAHCESLGIHKSLARMMADAPRCNFSLRRGGAAWQLTDSFIWDESEQDHYWWKAIYSILIDMAEIGECK